MKKLAIIGASDLQEPLIEKAGQMGIQTHVFAWEQGSMGKKKADFFYPVSIVEKCTILEICRKIGIDGVCSIASDLAVLTVNYIADQMGLTGNSLRCTALSTNKQMMRERFAKMGVPSPKSMCVENLCEARMQQLSYPIIVKPVDRSGSRGVTMLIQKDGLEQAVNRALHEGFAKKVLIEEYAKGQEYSAECMSWKGKHIFLALTKKYTSGRPHFIETAHLEPVKIETELLDRVKRTVYHALDSLEIQNGASHTEFKIDAMGNIKIIEIGGRMGGDFIGSDLVRISTGIDYVRAVIQVALGEEPDLSRDGMCACAAVRYVLDQKDLEALQQVKREHPEYVIRESVHKAVERKVSDSANRHGYYMLRADNVQALDRYMPKP